MKKFATTIVVCRQFNKPNYIVVSQVYYDILLFRANSEDEAYGKAMKRNLAWYKEEDGYYGHKAHVLEIKEENFND